MNEPKPHIYEFGDFCLDASRRLLLGRGGEPVPLTPKVFDTLLYLVEHGGTVLSKDELMAAVWPDTVVEENNLGQNISKLRGALGEKPHEHRYIATVPGRGYRFVAEVKAVTGDEAWGEVAAGAASEPVGKTATGETVSSSSQRSRHTGGRRSGLALALLAAAILVGLGGAGAYLWRARTRPPASQPVRTVAVLPFKPLVVEGRDEALELGMAETLITRLSNIRELTVRPLSSVRRYGKPEQDPFAAGRELGVEAVLDGSIQRWGDRVRVTARLVNVGDQKQLWAGQFDEKFTDIFSVQDAISERVARGLALELTGEERERLAKRYTDDAEAYQLYLKGRFLWNQLRAESIMKAVGFFEEAIRRDPNYALAYAGIADCYSRLPITSDVPAAEVMPKAKASAAKALEIDERLAEAHTALGWIKVFYDWDWEGAEREHRRALELNPNSPSAHLGYAALLSCLGRHEEALGEAERAVRLDPLSPINGALKGQSLFLARRYPEAVEHLRGALEINSNFWVALLQLGRSYERLGHYEEALEAFRNARESGGTTESLSLSGYTYAASGRKGEAERALRELATISEQSYVPPYNVALLHHGLGNTDEALKWLERAYQERDAHMVLLGVEPKWDSLRDNPRFINLLERTGLPR